MSSSPFYMATTALADRSASGGPRVAFTSSVWCDAVVGRYKAEATTVDFENKAGKARKQINEWTRQTPSCRRDPLARRWPSCSATPST
uniref:Uncharacterized protein n=1 Tax=Oryza glumipatula TaxID=40148 RepID=A0A0E0BUM9_9ORYZ